MDLVEVEYEPLPVVLDPEASAMAGPVPIHDQADPLRENRCWDQRTHMGDVEGAFERADVVLSQRFETSKQHAVPMETHAAVASWDRSDGKLTVRSSSSVS